MKMCPTDLAKFTRSPYFTESKEGQVKSDDLGKNIVSVQALITKHVRLHLMCYACTDFKSNILQETFEAGLSSFEAEGVQGLTDLKDKLVKDKHPQERQIKERHGSVLSK